MEEKDKRTIKSTDKIPGCERLTRPEEIKGLSKYLGNIREVQEEWISNNIPEDVENIRGDRLEVQSLPDSVIGLDTDDTKLKPGIERLSVPVEKLKPEIVSLEVDGPSELSQEKEKLNLGPEIKKLDDKKVGIRVEEITNLPESVIGLDAKDTPRLSDFIDTLFVGSTSSLRKDTVGLEVNDNPELEDTRLDITPGENKLRPGKENLRVPENELRPGIENISVPDNKLKPGREDIRVPENELRPDRIDLEVDNPELKRDRIDIEVPEARLKGDRVNIKVPTDYLKDDKIMLEVEDKTESFYNSQEDKEKASRKEISKTIIQGSLPVNERNRGGEPFNPEVIKSKFAIDSPYNTAATRTLEISDNEEYTNQWKAFDTEIESKTTEELYSDAVKILLNNPSVFGNMGKELAGVLSAYLGADDLEKAKAGADKIKNILISQRVLLGEEKKDRDERDNLLKSKIKNPDLPERVKYKLSEATFDSVDTYNPNRYIRYLAELATDSTVGLAEGKAGVWLRRSVLETTLRALVHQIRGIRDISLGRLPGTPDNSAVSNTLSALRKAGNLINATKSGNIFSAASAISSFEDDGARNRPESSSTTGWSASWKEKLLVEGAKYREQDLPESENRPSKINEESWSLGGKADNLEHTYNSKISKDYGLGLTLYDLCPNNDSPGTVTDLGKALKDSPYITTPSKTIKRLGAKNDATLDTNAYWEVIIEPLCDTVLNGGWSFLPSIAEINRENLVEHGINTAYSRWIPLSNVELQKSKVTSKSLGLFDGEINYPVSVEFTNELRMTVVDDQYKSWRRYFQRCADVSVFYSEAHRKEFYENSNKGQLLAIPTAIDKGKFCVAFYKNVTFRIRLYFMTPQYSTIKKFDLLCVMKDFSEEYMGDIDAGALDLNISFSIVGENPEESRENELVYDGKAYNDSEDYLASHNEKDRDWSNKWKNLLTSEEVKDTSTKDKTGDRKPVKVVEEKPAESPAESSSIMNYTPTSFATEIEGTGTQTVRLTNGSYPSEAQPKSGRDNASNSII